MPVRRPLAAAAAFFCLARHRVFLGSGQLRFPELRARTGWNRGLHATGAVAERKAAAGAAGAATPEAAVQALLRAAGAGAGSPPPEVVGAALKATNVEATKENVQRALQLALGGAAPTDAQIDQAMRAATDGLPPDFFEAPPAAPASPEEVALALGPGARADAIGTALRQSGLEISAENVLRALKAAKPGTEPSSQDLGDALKAAMAQPGPQGYGVGPTSAELPGAAPGAVPGATAAAMQTPEEVVRALLELAGPDAGAAPPEVLGSALQAAGFPLTRENVERALKASGTPSPTEEDLQKALQGSPAVAPGPVPAVGPQSSPEEVIFALRVAAGPGAGVPPPEVVGAALHQAKVTPLSAEAVVRALKEAGHTSPTPDMIQAALQSAVSGKLPENLE